MLPRLLSNSWPASASQSAGITGVSHRAWPHFLYSLISWWTLRLLQILAVVNGAWMNMGVQTYLFNILVSFLLGKNSAEGFLDCIVPLFLIFYSETSKLFFIMVLLIYIPTNSVWGFPFLHICTSVWYCLTLFIFWDRVSLCHPGWTGTIGMCHHAWLAWLLDKSHFTWSEMIWHCSSDLYISDDQ